MNVLESIVRDLRELPEPRLAEVARYVKCLHGPNAVLRQAALAATAGCLHGAEGGDFERAVQAEGERLDGDSA